MEQCQNIVTFVWRCWNW